MQSSIGQNFVLFSAILAKGKLGTRRGTWNESNTGHGPCWPGFGAAYVEEDLLYTEMCQVFRFDRSCSCCRAVFVAGARFFE